MEAPSVEEAKKLFEGKVSIIGVTWSGSASSYEAFIARHGLSFPNIDDSDGELFARLGVVGQPAWAMVKANGEAEVMMGVLSDAELAEQLELLSQS